MSIQDYVKAQKLAEKQRRRAISDGNTPYPLVLEKLLRKSEVEGQLPLGQIEIPLSLVVGTASADRNNAFTYDFMPLLEYGTEFSSKWSALIDSVKEIGINEPIKVYEYMQRFYVVEGNKRVSVSKFNGAVTIYADVTRIIPQKDDSEESIVYSEFMEFYRIAGIYDILMKHPGEFPRLIQIFGAPPEGQERTYVWDEEMRRTVRFLYSVFETHYISRGGQRLSAITTGEAFLHFAEIYGKRRMLKLSSLKMRRYIDRIWDEFRVLADDRPTNRILSPTEGSQKPSIVKKIPLPVSSSVLKIAFIYPTDPEHSGWSYNHELGRLIVSEHFGSEISTTSYIADAEHAEEKIKEAIHEGCKLIFTTSPVFHAVTMRIAVSHPEVILLNCSMNTTYKQLRTYYLRIYEAKFINGIIAGSMTETERIGYIADYPIIGTPASVSAFALGVKLVNPRAIVHLDWSTLENHDPAEYFRSKQIDIISDRDINNPGDDPEAFRNFGLYGIYGGNHFRLSAPVWNWGSLYENLVRSVLIGAWKNDSNDNQTHALNYYWGMSSGAIDVACTPKLPSGTKRLVEIMRKEIAANHYNPFTGILYERSGQCVVPADETLSIEEILNINWLPDNVWGRIPAVEELAPKFRDFARWHALTPDSDSETASN